MKFANWCSALLALMVLSQTHAAPDAVAVPPVWKDTPAQFAKLSQDITFLGYGIRVPANYSAIPDSPQTEDARKKGYDYRGWSPGANSNGTRPLIAAVVLTPPPSADATPAQVPPMDDLLGAAISDQANTWEDFVESKIEHGTINGFAFERAYYKGTMIVRNQPLSAHGIVYVTTDGVKAISFVAQDVEPYSAASLPVMDSIVPTFHRLPPPTSPAPAP